MESILANLMKVQGVLAAAVFAADDSCVEFSAAEPIFEPIMFLAAMRAAEDSLDVFRTMDRLADATSFTCELEHGYFSYRTVGAMRMGVMAATGINVAMLDVAIGVASLKLAQAEQRRAQYSTSSSAEYAVPHATGSRPSAQYAVPGMVQHYGSAPMSPMSLSGPIPSPMAAAPSMASGPTARHHSPTSPPPLPPQARGQATGSQPHTPTPGSSSGLLQGQPFEDWRAEELLANGARVPGTIGPSAMQHVLRSLARFLGGHAKAVIVEELAQLGATPATARPELFTDLIYNVAGRIPDPGMHDEFVRLALGDRR